jgi:hypothetical protein
MCPAIWQGKQKPGPESGHWVPVCRLKVRGFFSRTYLVPVLAGQSTVAFKKPVYSTT